MRLFGDSVTAFIAIQLRETAAQQTMQGTVATFCRASELQWARQLHCYEYNRGVLTDYSTGHEQYECSVKQKW